jgi:hypothetical protein
VELDEEVVQKYLYTGTGPALDVRYGPVYE